MKFLETLSIVHRDLAARNCLVGSNLVVKISDLGTARSFYSADYYHLDDRSFLPIRWMAWEAVLLVRTRSQQCMDGRMDRWRDWWKHWQVAVGWKDYTELMDEWMNGWMDGLIDGSMDGWMNGLIDWWTNWWMDWWINELMGGYEWMDGYMDGWLTDSVDELMNQSIFGRSGAWIDVQVDGK